MGAISINGSPALRAQFEPLLPGCLRAPMPYRYRCPYCAEHPSCTLQCADEIDSIIRNEDPSTVAAVILEPVQNSAGSIVPPEGYFTRVREICDEHGVLLVADEVICGFGRLGEWFGSTKYGIEPDMMTMAKGLTSAYAPLGAVAASEKVIEPFFAEPSSMFVHGITFGGHPVACAIALANLEIIEREDLIGHVQRMTPEFRGAFDTLAAEHPMIGEVRGDGCFYSFELVKDKETKETFTPAERDVLIKQFMVPRARELGVYMRVDDRAETAAQFSPPLVAGRAELDEFLGVFRQVLDEAYDRFVLNPS
jgi:adenosylmethionine-8-amino-7-oxononanoate aminotransferase